MSRIWKKKDKSTFRTLHKRLIRWAARGLSARRAVPLRFNTADVSDFLPPPKKPPGICREASFIWLWFKDQIRSAVKDKAVHTVDGAFFIPFEIIDAFDEGASGSLVAREVILFDLILIQGDRGGKA